MAMDSSAFDDDEADAPASAPIPRQRRLARGFGEALAASVGTKYGGEAPANMLIREYARKGHYWCSLWCSHDCDDGHVFSAEDRAGYKSSMEFLDFMCMLPAESETFAAGMQIVNWEP